MNNQTITLTPWAFAKRGAVYFAFYGAIMGFMIGSLAFSMLALANYSGNKHREWTAEDIGGGLLMILLSSIFAGAICGIPSGALIGSVMGALTLARIGKGSSGIPLPQEVLRKSLDGGKRLGFKEGIYGGGLMAAIGFALAWNFQPQNLELAATLISAFSLGLVLGAIGGGISGLLRGSERWANQEKKHQIDEALKGSMDAKTAQ